MIQVVTWSTSMLQVCYENNEFKRTSRVWTWGWGWGIRSFQSDAGREHWCLFCWLERTLFPRTASWGEVHSWRLRIRSSVMDIKVQHEVKGSEANRGGTEEAYGWMSHLEHLEKLLEFGTTKMSDGTQTGEETTIGELLEVPLADVLKWSRCSIWEPFFRKGTPMAYIPALWFGCQTSLWTVWWKCGQTPNRCPPRHGWCQSAIQTAAGSLSPTGSRPTQAGTGHSLHYPEQDSSHSPFCRGIWWLSLTCTWCP